MSKEAGAAAFRKTWDKESFELKAKARLDEELKLGCWLKVRPGLSVTAAGLLWLPYVSSRPGSAASLQPRDLCWRDGAACPHAVASSHLSTLRLEEEREANIQAPQPIVQRAPLRG